MNGPTVALGIPHRPDRPERVRNLQDLRNTLDCPPPSIPRTTIKVFDAPKPNRAWARDMWTWGAESGADFFLTLQDDVRVCPRFWEVLQAMLAHLPKDALLGPAAQDTRIGLGMRPWVRSRAWVVGWAYGMWAPRLRELVTYDLSGQDAQWTEDTFVNEWAKKHAIDVWHPVPTPVQHRLEIPSTYDNWPKPASCDWEALPTAEQVRMAYPAYWAPKAPPPHLPGMVMAGTPGPTLTHPNIMSGPNWGGSPPAPR